MKQLFITGGMFLGALVIIVIISQVLDVVMSPKVQKMDDRYVPSIKPDERPTRPPQPGGRRPPLRSTEQG